LHTNFSPDDKNSIHRQIRNKVLWKQKMVVYRELTVHICIALINTCWTLDCRFMTVIYSRCLNWFLAGLHKVHPAYRMVNAGRPGVFNRVPTLCNQLLPHLLADILQTLRSCYRHIEDVHVTFWKYSDIFRKISM
jgi:hypothetical protein